MAVKIVVSGRVRWTDLTPSEWRQQDERAMADLKATGTVQPYEKEFIRKDGTRVAVLVGGALFDARGNDGVAFALDLSKQKQAEAEIRALKDQLYRENLALRDEVDRVFDVRGNRRFIEDVEDRAVAHRQGGSHRLDRVHHRRDGYRQGTHRPRRPQTIPEGGRAFVSVNCAALAPTLISSELFGHEKRRLHRSYAAATRPVRDGRRRHHLPG